MSVFQIYSIDSDGIPTLRTELMDATRLEALYIVLRMQQASRTVQTWFLNCGSEARRGEPERLN